MSTPPEWLSENIFTERTKVPNLVQRFVVSCKNKMDRLQKFCANLTAKIMKKAKNNEKCR